MDNFDDKLKKLEEINEKLSAGNISLDNAQTLFKEGIELSKELEQHLDSVQKSIEILINNSNDEEPIFESFSEAD